MIQIGYHEVTQVKVGYPHGECVRASYASLLELPLEAVPDFDPASLAGRDQRRAEREWLASLGLELLEIPVQERLGGDERVPGIPPVFHLISGESPRIANMGHRCVGHGGRLVWDPHPSRAGVVTPWNVGLVVLAGATLNDIFDPAVYLAEVRGRRS